MTTAVVGITTDSVANEIFGSSIDMERKKSKSALKDFYEMYSCVSRETYQSYKAKLNNATKKGECSQIMTSFRHNELN